jgi:VIT1/CCC1 family predicted Fe2+/Mn2+ transporter
MQDPQAMPEHGHSQSEVERRINAPAGRGYLRDTVYGAIDGAVTTFAIVAGVAGAGLSPFVIVALGLANVLADGFSMAAGNYSGTKAERDDARRLAAVENRHLDATPEGERREIREILRQKGLEGAVLEDATDQVAAKRDSAVKLMLTDEYGLSPVEPNPMRAALATFAAFLAAGMVPLLPFLIGLPDAFRLSAVMTGVVFFGIGAAKSVWSLAPWWRSGAETLAIGGTAAGVAYIVGTLFAA